MKRSIFIVANLFFAPKLSQSCTILNVTPIRQSFEGGNETCDLLLPVVQRRGWSYDKKWAPNVMYFSKVRNERYRLDSLYSCQIERHNREHNAPFQVPFHPLEYH